MRQRIDLTGKVFTRLRVTKELPDEKRVSSESVWECQCICSKICKIPGYHLRIGLRKSCGCMWKPHEPLYVNQALYMLEINSKWENNCHVWKGNVNRKGEGIVHLAPKKPILIQRLSWMIYIGKIPKGIDVHSNCGNPLCFRIEHLFQIK